VTSTPLTCSKSSDFNTKVSKAEHTHSLEHLNYTQINVTVHVVTIVISHHPFCHQTEYMKKNFLSSQHQHSSMCKLVLMELPSDHFSFPKSTHLGLFEEPAGVDQEIVPASVPPTADLTSPGLPIPVLEVLISV
jgi:hypothetical protein